MSPIPETADLVRRTEALAERQRAARLARVGPERDFVDGQTSLLDDGDPESTQQVA